MVRSVVFDCANTLLYLEPSDAEIFRRALIFDRQHFSEFEIAEVIRNQDRVRSLPSREVDSQTFRRSTYENFNRLVLRGLGIGQPEPELLKRIENMMGARNRWTTAPSVGESLERLSRVAPLYVFSNWSHSLSDTLTLHGLRHFFTAVSSSAELGLEKPSKSAFEKFMHVHALDAAATCYVGDDYQLDIRPSYAVGMFPIWLNATVLPNPLEVTQVGNWVDLEGVLLEWIRGD